MVVALGNCVENYQPIAVVNDMLSRQIVACILNFDFFLTIMKKLYIFLL